MFEKSSFGRTMRLHLLMSLCLVIAVPYRLRISLVLQIAKSKFSQREMEKGRKIKKKNSNSITQFYTIFFSLVWYFASIRFGHIFFRSEKSHFPPNNAFCAPVLDTLFTDQLTIPLIDNTASVYSFTQTA